MIRPNIETSAREREKFPEPEPLRADRQIKINGAEIQEFQFKGNLYVYVNGFPCRETYEDAIKICAKHKGREVITEVSFALSVCDNSSGFFCNHIEFLYDPKSDRITEVSIQGVAMQPIEVFEQMIWRLYPRAELYRAACEAIENAPDLPKIIGA